MGDLPSDKPPVNPPELPDDCDSTAIAIVKSIAEAKREEIARQFPAEYASGIQAGFLDASEGPALRYPDNFKIWSIERKNAWYAGWNYSYSTVNTYKPKAYLEPWAMELRKQIGDEAFYRNHPELIGYD